jgi:hypothetical protein
MARMDNDPSHSIHAGGDEEPEETPLLGRTQHNVQGGVRQR